MAAPTEETFIEGLRAYAAQSERLEALLAKKRAEIGEDPEDLERLQTMRDLLHLNSVYPTQLDLASLSIASLRESSLARAREIRLRNLGDDEEAKQAAEEGARASKEIAEAVGPTGLFYRRLLLEDREPEYFGATVQPGESDAVLVRWKHDDQHMRVVYGDLRIETVRIEE
jgi:hypothetical protein